MTSGVSGGTDAPVHGRRRFLQGGLGLAAAGMVGSRVGALPSLTTPASSGGSFITRKGNLLVGPNGQPKRFAGANLYWLGLDDNLGSAPAYPSNQAIRQGLSAAAALGCSVVRSHTLGISVGNPLSVMPIYGEVNSAAFAPIDYAVAAAGQMGLRLIIPLVDQWRYYHGGKWVFVQWAAQRGVPGVSAPNPDRAVNCANSGAEKAVEAAFYSNSAVIGSFQSYILALLSHRNLYTGIPLSADPTILAWETGNEIWDATPAWTATIASYLKQLAPKTLVADGSAATGLSVAQAPGLGVAAVDIVGSHYYPPSIPQLTADAAAAAGASKAMFVGEWPSTTPGVPLGQWTSALESTPGVSGDAVWSILPWGAGGSPEAHGDGYALHVPGASAGEVAVGSGVFAHAAVMRT